MVVVSFGQAKVPRTLHTSATSLFEMVPVLGQIRRREMVPPKQRKRRRAWDPVRRIGLLLLPSTLPSAFGQSSFYATCRGQLQTADLDGDEALSESEFKSFLFQFSGGKATYGDSELPVTFTQAFVNRRKDETQSMDISAGSGGAIDFFCKEIYSGLSELFDVSVSNQDCIVALQAGDTQPTNGQLTTTEYVPFLNSLTSSQDYSEPFDSLSTSLQNVFNDMSEGGVINGSKGTEYLVEFCERSLLAVVIPTVSTTPAPTGTSGATALPTFGGSSVGSTIAPTQLGSGGSNTIAPTQSGSGNTPLPTMIVGSTLIPTSVLAQATSLPTIATTVDSSMIDGTIPPTMIGSTNTLSPSLSGSSNQTPRPTSTGTSVGSSDVSGLTTAPTLQPTIFEKTPAPTFASLSASQFNTCKTALVVSDINRNDRLEKQEFVRFLARMSSNPELASYPAIQNIDGIYQDLYDNLSAKSVDGLPRLNGTKPGTTPTRSERAVILDICQQTYQTIRRYEQSGPDDDPNDDSLVGEFYLRCKSAMVVSDLNRDDVLEKTEFVRFVSRLHPDSSSQISTFKQLDPAFRKSYDEVASSKGVVIFGSKPGQRSTVAHDDHLQAVCQSTKSAMDFVDSNGVSSDPLPPPTSSPTIAPGSITNDFFRRCKTAMLIADLDRDDSIDRVEYVRILNRLTISQFAGKGFSELDAIFQLGFYKVAVNGQIDVYGSKPGQSVSRKTNSHLSFVCKNVKESLDIFALTGGSGTKPVPPTPSTLIEPDNAPTSLTKAPVSDMDAPSQAPATRSELENCKEGIMRADTNRNFLLEKEEFALFIGSSSSQNIDQSFSSLPTPYSAAFVTASGHGEAVDLASMETSHLENLCEAILAQGDLSTVLSPATCSASLFSSDTDSNNRLTEDEYATFVHELRKSRKTSFDILPFVVRNNFSWLTLKRSYVDINGASTLEAYESGDDIRLHWMCERTGRVLQALDNDESITLNDHCEAMMRKSDVDSNGYIDQQEFIELLRKFTGAKFSGLDFQSVGSFRNVFNTARSDDNDMVDVETAVTNGVCFELQKAADEVRDSEAFFELCFDSLRVADSDSDESLGKEEYISFLYNLAIVYGHAERLPVGLQYENLNQVLRLNYDVLAGQNDSVLIPGVHSQPTDGQFGDLRWVCQNTEGIVDLISSAQESVVTIYNAFFISNTKGVVAADLEDGPDRDLLEAAYSEFVEDQIKILRKQRKTRKLAVGEYIPSTASIYQIDDAQCFSDFPSTVFCQIIYCSFDVALVNENDEDAAAAKYSETTQLTIDRGALQLKLILLDPNAAFNVEQAVNPPKPSSNQIFVPTGGSNADEIPEDDEASLFMTLLSGALVSSAIFFTLYYWFCYIRKGKTLCGECKNSRDTDDETKLSEKPPVQHDSSRTGEDEETGFSVRSRKGTETKDENLFDEENISVESSSDNSFVDFVASGARDSSKNPDEELSDGSSQSSDHSFKQRSEALSTNSMKSGSDSSRSESSGLSERSEQFEKMTSASSSSDGSVDKLEKSREISESPSFSENDVNLVDSAKSSDHSERLESSSGDDSDLIGDIKQEEAPFPNASQSPAYDGDDVSDHSDVNDSTSQNPSESIVDEDDNIEGEYSVEEPDEEEQEDRESMSFDEADTLVHSTMSLDTAVANASYEKYRPIVEDLVRQVVPDEINNIDTMMEQFIGRERELVRTLRNMAGIEDSDEEDSEDFEPSDYSEPSEYSAADDGHDFSEVVSEDGESYESEGQMESDEDE